MEQEIILEQESILVGGTTDYEELTNKPSINNVELSGNKSLSDLGIENYDDTEIKADINNLESTKVDKELNKGLSTNDYTTEEKTKLSNLENYNDTQVKSDISSLQTNKADKSTTYTKTEVDNLIPDVSNFITNSVNDLINYYLKSETYTKTEVNNLIGAINQFHYEIVQELPQTGQTNILYLVPKSTSQTNNTYDEYVYANNNWEKIGDTEIDLSNYVTTTQLNTALADYTTTTNLNTLLSTKQDTLVSGTNIKTINNTSLLGSGNINISGDVSVVFINYSDTQAVKEEKYQQLIDNFKDGKESIIMYYKNDNTMVMTKFASAVNEQNEGYIAFKGFYLPNFQSSNYGIQYQFYSDFKFFIYFANYVFTSVSDFGGTVGLMPMNGYYSLGLYNTSEYTPTEDYNPATKKYVDDKVSNIKLITINNGETTTEKEEKYQQAIDNYKNGIETIIFFYFSGSNVYAEQPIVLKLEKAEESNGTGKITFSGYYMPNGTINWYGINYTGMNDWRLIINFTNYVYTSASGQNLTKGYMITESSYTNILGKTNNQQWAPTGDYNPSTKIYTDKTHYENMTGYDATKTQVLKNINGTLTWVDEA